MDTLKDSHKFQKVRQMHLLYAKNPLLYVAFLSTRMMLQQILVFTVTRGILVCLVQVGHIVMYVFDPKNMLFWQVIS